MSDVERPAITILFPDQTKARGAFETLLELGYKPEMLGSGLMDVKIEQQDITTALEIVEVFEGKIQDENGNREGIIPNSDAKHDTEFAYLSIPAHTVNEDLDEAYLSGRSDNPFGDNFLEEDRNYSNDHDDFGAAYGGFSGSVKA
ncbi:hypothetical protein [Paenibacillus gallinarum]|uniref:Uncharacterized protein n=1 Tax=Paenibacillus gallinarum TaxID=2762232 RepID=A0ABR8SZ96_9BACL|nr:hypothetical protein [Paenibacillus gallinarum]MBD7968842.1 hypothetical protein [Paenibacillus gallinarum]